MGNQITTPDYSGGDRRSFSTSPAPLETDGDVRFHHIDTRFEEGAQRMESLEKKVDTLKKTVDTNNEQTAEVLEILQSAKGFFKVLGYIGTFVKYCVSVGAAAAALYAAWRSAYPPH